MLSLLLPLSLSLLLLPLLLFDVVVDVIVSDGLKSSSRRPQDCPERPKGVVVVVAVVGVGAMLVQ